MGLLGRAVALSSCLLASASLAGTGDVDVTFGTTGFGLSSPADAFIDAVMLPDDGYVVFGSELTAFPGGTTQAPALTWYTADGRYDLNFGAGTGTRSSEIPGQHFVAASLHRQASGRLIGVGTVRPDDGPLPPTRLVTVLGFLPDGSLDPSFGSGGNATGPAVAADNVAGTVLPDGSIVVAGRPSAPEVGELSLTRFSPDGALDAGFGSGGTALHAIGGGSAIGHGPGDTIIVAGLYGDDLHVTRFTADGSLDGSFGTGGQTIVPHPELGQPARALVVLDDGAIVVAGEAAHLAFLAKVDVTGTLDPSFGVGGIARVRHPGVSASARDLALAPDGKLLVSNRIVVRGTSEILHLLVRHHADGSVDPTFGAGGRSLVPSAAGVVLQQSTGAVLAVHERQSRVDASCPTLPDADGDGLGDACDPCTGGAATLASTKLSMKGDFGLPAGGRSSATWRGRAVSTLPGFDPDQTGVVLVVEDASGGVLQSTLVPHARFIDELETKTGWKVKAPRWTFKDTGKPNPPADGVVAVKVKRSSGGEVSFTVKLKNTYFRVAPSQLPLRATLVLTPPRAAGDGCLVSEFPSCLHAGKSLLCR